MCRQVRQAGINGAEEDKALCGPCGRSHAHFREEETEGLAPSHRVGDWGPGAGAGQQLVDHTCCSGSEGGLSLRHVWSCITNLHSPAIC